ADQAIFRGEQAAEIAIPIGRGGNARVRIYDIDLAKLLEAEEEEGLVRAVIDLRNSHRTANREAPIALADLVSKSRVRLARVQGLIGSVIVARTVKLVGSALGDHADHGAAGGAELRGEVAGLNRDLLDRVRGRLGL